MDVHSLKEYIKSNTNFIELILEKTGFYDISGDFGDGSEYRCAWEDGGNPTGVRVSKDTLSANYFKKGIKGDLFTLIQDKLNLSFPKAVKLVSDIIEYIEIPTYNYELPFGGFYKKIQKFKDDGNLDLTTYDDDLLEQFEKVPNLMFYQDGINLDVQREFEIGYDSVTKRISVPWRSTSGDLVGIMGRKNVRETDDNKWMPILAFPKSKVIYGFSENYKQIQEKGTCFIFESEKGTLGLKSMGIPLGLSLGGSSLSKEQSNNIKSLFCNKIIIGLDEGLDKETSIDMAEKLKMNRFFKNEVYYIYDEHNLWIPKNSKMSPTDLPKSDFKSLLKHCLVKVE